MREKGREGDLGRGEGGGDEGARRVQRLALLHDEGLEEVGGAALGRRGRQRSDGNRREGGWWGREGEGKGEGEGEGEGEVEVEVEGRGEGEGEREFGWNIVKIWRGRKV
eukprot:1024963-Rhodomonas_salina.2